MSFWAVILLFLLPRGFVLQELSLAPGVYPIRRTQSSTEAGLRQTIKIGGQFVSVGPALSYLRAVIYATNNSNDLFSATVYFPGAAGCSDSTLLQLDGESIVSKGYGSDSPNNTCHVIFPLTPAQATRAAVFFKTTRQDRHEIGQQLASTFSVSDSFDLVVRIMNPPDALPVQWQKGGRNRGPRDNQFSMRITRDGQPVRTIEAGDFGGLGAIMVLRPGEAVEVRAPISSWGDISIPGRYVVEGAYETVLAPPIGIRPLEEYLGQIWDRRFEGRVTFEVH